MRAAILGTAGYSGQETLDRVLAHPGLEPAALGSDSLAGQRAAALDPRLARNGASAAPAFVTNDEALASGADVVFLCIGHEEAARIEPPAEGVVVDLSGGHRLGYQLNSGLRARMHKFYGGRGRTRTGTPVSQKQILSRIDRDFPSICRSRHFCSGP